MGLSVAEMRDLAVNPRDQYDRESVGGWRIAAEICERLEEQNRLLNRMLENTKRRSDAVAAAAAGTESPATEHARRAAELREQLS